MSAIGSVGSGAVQSPLSRLKAELTSEVSTGSVKSTDETALSGALDDIDPALNPNGSSGSSSKASSPPDPSDVKTKISSLIDTEVSSGKLTSDQATELKQIFTNAAPTGGSGGAGGPGGPGGGGGPGGAGGPPPGPPPSGGGGSDASSSSDDSSSTSSTTSSTTSASDLLADFLKTLQSSQANTYSADGGAASNASSSLLLSYTA